MTLEKVPFRNYTLDSDKKEPKRDVTSISLNKVDREMLEQVKEAFNLNADSRAIRICIEISRNVLIGQLSPKTWSYLFSKDRSRLSDFRRIKIESIET